MSGVNGKDILLLSGSTLATLAIAIGLIRWLAPGLLGINADLVLVKSSGEAVPFFETAINIPADESLLVPDPLVKQRGMPLLQDWGPIGPGDLLGFRNRSVINYADVLIVGDSQTYGNAAIIYENWPHQLQRGLSTGSSVYSMATGGWGAIQYLYAARKGLAFSPKVLIVAFYSGNDALKSFMLAYGSEIWNHLRPDPALAATDAPHYPYPPPAEDEWRVTFDDGQQTVFTPKLRYASNQRHPAVDAGYRIMLEVSRRITRQATQAGAKVVFTIIPTKELVHQQRIAFEGIQPPPSYLQLIEAEGGASHGWRKRLRLSRARIL